MPSLKDLRTASPRSRRRRRSPRRCRWSPRRSCAARRKRPRPRAPIRERMGAVLANIAQAVGGGGDAPALMTGTGKDEVHLLVVCTAERGLCGGFNSQIARLARDHIRKLLADGKTGQDHLRRQEGLRHPAPRLRVADHRARRPARGQDSSASSMPTRSASKVIDLFDEGEFDVCTLFYSRVQVGDLPDPDRAAAHPGRRRLPLRPRRRTAATPSTNTSRSRARSSPTSFRATSRCRSSARCSKTQPARWAPR